MHISDTNNLVIAGAPEITENSLETDLNLLGSTFIGGNILSCRVPVTVKNY